MRKRITTRLVERLQPPEVGSTIVWDGQVPGFGARVTAGGIKAFLLQYTLHGRERSSTIGRYPEWPVEDARQRALVWRRAVSEGKDPTEERKADRTLLDLSREFIKHGQTYKRASSIKNERYLLDGIVLPRLGTFQLKAVGRKDVEQLHAQLQATPYQANRVLAMLSKMFNLGKTWGWCQGDNPVKGVPRYHEEKREAWLEQQQMERLERALDSYEDQEAANALRLLILTGARKSEALQAEWPQFDFARGIWIKPSHHTKQKKVEHVALSQAALQLLKKMKPKKAGPLFPGRRSGTRVSLRRPWRQICKAAGLTEAVTVKGKRRTITRHKPKVRVHDLRHNYASWLVSDGVGLPVVGRLLGHTQAQTTMRYAHVFDEAQRKATNRFSELTRNGGKK